MKIGISFGTINGSERFYKAMQSVRDAGDDFAAVVLVDDGSCERELQILRELCKHYEVEFREHRRNMGISATWNHGIAYLGEKGCDLVVVCNDDIKVTKGWLKAIEFFYENNPLVGMVGLHARVDGKLVCTDNNIKKYEGEVDFSVPHRGLCANGFCFSVDYGLWKDLNYFDEGYQSFYEELDLGCHMAGRGIFSYNIPWPVIEHEWGSTFSQNPNLLAEIRMKKSKERFMEKWGGEMPQMYEKYVSFNSSMEMTWLQDGEVKRGRPVNVIR